MGFAAQEDIQQTIESALFEASDVYHRCGRTNKGVSASARVISLDVRTNLKAGKGVITGDDYVGDDSVEDNSDVQEVQEMNYSLILNNVLLKIFV
jgi:tRNA U38,U39,U40 pseudouridine synthase TruA